MKALSLWQPWASLVVLGLKQYETRSWKTTYRGTLVIHAAKTWNMECSDALSEFTNRFKVELGNAPFGMAIGSVELVEVFPTDFIDKRLLSKQERAFGDFNKGRYAWMLRNPIMFTEPIPCTGHQRLWEVE